MFDINGWELIVLGLLAVFVLGPERLPEYASKLATLVRQLRAMANGARDQLKDQLGPEFDDVNWRQFDPRQYDPRRIVREALADTGAVPEPRVFADESGAAQTPVGAAYDPGKPTPWDPDAT